ncbi:MAG: 4Fe-4S binding protein [Bernardetiaceae bacterium]|nr:4Fe-4S binding protein [Bernardetiaceae bacterium]
MSYWKELAEGLKSLGKGMRLTYSHLRKAMRKPKYEALSPQDPNYFKQADGIATVRYPFETAPMPDNVRNLLHNEIEDCIVCDKCADVCPVDCIDIEGIRAPEVIGHASDGTPIRIYAAKFDIDMAKCCYCGLCTVVCPTECLTMTPDFDYSTNNIAEMIYKFGTLTQEEADQKRIELEEAKKVKKTAKEPTKKITTKTNTSELPSEDKPKPTIKLKKTTTEDKPKPEDTE